MGTIVEDVIIEDIKELKRENSRLKAENDKLKKELEQAGRSYDILLKENEALLLRVDRLEAQNKELKKRIEDFKVHTKSLDDIILKLKDENNKLQQWTLNDRKVRHGFDLAIETLNKCKERDTE